MNDRLSDPARLLLYRLGSGLALLACLIPGGTVMRVVRGYWATETTQAAVVAAGYAAAVIGVAGLAAAPKAWALGLCGWLDRGRWRVRALKAIFACVGTFMAGEVGCRAAAAMGLEIGRAACWNPVLYDTTWTFFHEYRTLRDVRGDEAPKAPGVFRIAAVGDSMTFGFAVAREDAWPARLEALLRERCSPRVEILNLGWPGHNTVMEADRLARCVDRIGPDLVLLCFVGNDAEDRPVVFNPLTKLTPWYERPMFWSYFYFFLKARYWTWRPPPFQKNQRQFEADFAPDSPTWARCREAIGRLARMARDRKAPLACVTWGFRGMSPAVHDRVARAFEEEGVSTTLLDPVFAGLPAREIEVPNDGHPTPFAHGLATEAIAGHLLKSRLLPCGDGRR